MGADVPCSAPWLLLQLDMGTKTAAGQKKLRSCLQSSFQDLVLLVLARYQEVARR